MPGTYIPPSTSITVTETIPTNLLSGEEKTIPSTSGGIILSSGEVKSVVIKALSTNKGEIYVGSGTTPPTEGVGFKLEPGEAVIVDIDNLNKIRLYATASGDKVTFFAVD